MMSKNNNCEEVNELLEAVNNNDVHKVEELLKKGADVNREGKLRENDWKLVTPLCEAAYRGYVDIVKALLLSPNIDIEKTDFRDTTPFFNAAAYGHREVVQAFLETKKIQINKGDKIEGCTALHTASNYGCLEVVEALLEYPGILVNAKTRCGGTALHLADGRGHLEIVEILLSVPGILVNEKTNEHGYTPLHLAAAHGHSDVVEALLSHPDTNLNVKDKYLKTPLHMSANESDLKTVSLLLEGGIDASARDIMGYTAAYVAAQQAKSVQAKQAHQVLTLIVHYLKRVQEHGVDVDARRKQVEDITRRKELAKIWKHKICQQKGARRN